MRRQSGRLDGGDGNWKECLCQNLVRDTTLLIEDGDGTAHVLREKGVAEIGIFDEIDSEQQEEE